MPDEDDRCPAEDAACSREEGMLHEGCSWRACTAGERGGGPGSYSCSGPPAGDARPGGQRVSGVPLAMVGAGRRVKLLALHTGRECAARLSAMGLVPGAEIEVLRNASRGPFMVSVKGSRVVLGRGVAQRVMVG